MSALPRRTSTVHFYHLVWVKNSCHGRNKNVKLVIFVSAIRNQDQPQTWHVAATHREEVNLFQSDCLLRDKNGYILRLQASRVIPDTKLFTQTHEAFLLGDQCQRRFTANSLRRRVCFFVALYSKATLSEASVHFSVSQLIGGVGCMGEGGRRGMERGERGFGLNWLGPATADPGYTFLQMRSWTRATTGQKTTLNK